MGLSEQTVSLGEEPREGQGLIEGGDRMRRAEIMKRDKMKQTQLKIKIANDLVGLTNQKTVLKGISNILKRYEILWVSKET